ncbi:hypothetical protein [Marinobacter sp.]|uniref:hypothetical protein n=1 Tax=Marinobacter sp. TaxID=50741 RepID=UPI003568E8CD
MRTKAPVWIASSFIAPWMLLIAAWQSKSLRYRHWMLTLFVTLYGTTITIAFDPSGQGPDGVRHLLGVYTHYVGLGFGQFLSELWQILTFQESDAPSKDVYKHLLSYLTGGVLGFPSLFFPIVAFVYGYFFTGSMLHVFRQFGETKLTYVFLGFAVLFFLVKNIEGVNTVRTWTGMWILVYACLKYYETKKIRYAVLMFVPPFIHLGYFIMAIPAWIVLVVGNKPRVFAILFVLSSFTTFFNPGTVTELIAVTEVGESSVRGYFREEVVTGEEILETGREAGLRIWLTLEMFGVQKWALNIFVYVLLLTGVYFSVMNRQQKTLFSVGLLTITLSNATWYLYAVSNRSWVVGTIFLLAAYLMARQNPSTARRLPNSNPVYKIGLHLVLLLFVPYFIYNLTILLDFPSVFMFGLPFVVWIFPEVNISIKEALQYLLGIGR